MMEKIGDKLAIYQRYEEIYAESEPFHVALADVYYDIILFLCRARTVFKSNGNDNDFSTRWKRLTANIRLYSPEYALQSHLETFRK